MVSEQDISGKKEGNPMKKFTLILLTVLLSAVILTGCSCEHEWTEATCTAPKTCTLCGLTEGETLGHSWQEADCVTAKTCVRCDLKEGSLLGHSWKEATCTDAKTCTLCAVTEGNPLDHTWVGETTLYTAPSCAVCGITGETLPGYLAQNGLKPNISPEITVDYVNSTFVRSDLDTTGLLTASEVQIFDYDSTHRARAGYEWRRANVSILFNDNRFDMYGTNVAYARADYYQDQELKQPRRQENFPIMYNDQEYWCLAIYDDMGFVHEDSGSIYHLTVHVQVPTGYDGVVLAFLRGSTDITGKHLHEVADENLLLLRMA